MSEVTPLQEAKRKAILAALRKGNTRRAACEAAGVNESTLWRWMQADATICNAVKKAEADAEQFFVARVQEAAGDTWTAAAWWLERRRRDDWSKPEKIEHSGPDGGPVQVQYVNDWRGVARREIQSPDDPTAVPAHGTAGGEDTGEAP